MIAWLGPVGLGDQKAPLLCSRTEFRYLDCANGGSGDQMLKRGLKRVGTIKSSWKATIPIPRAAFRPDS